MTKRIYFLLAFVFYFIQANATTWREPWQKEIIEKSDCLVYGKVLTVSDTLVTVSIQKSFIKPLTGVIKIDAFFMLELCSYSGGHDPEFDIKQGEEGYFFLKKGENGNYQLPTPTSGFHPIVDGKVYATYRHSYHQAAIEVSVYEMTYSTIWKHYRTGKSDITEVKKFIQEYLSKPVASFEDDEIDVFFNQHAALESAYLLEIPIDFTILKKFSESSNYHSQISAIRAIGVLDSKEVKDYLIEFITGDNENNFAKVMAIWSIVNRGDKKYLKELIKKKDIISDGETGFGGNIMDPRVCTSIPSPKQAVGNIKL